MGRPKKVLHTNAVEEKVEVVPIMHKVVHTPLTFLSVDYPTEGLNDIARKINQIIEHINGH